MRPVGALRQNPSNAAHQIRPESGPTTSRQMLTLSEPPSDRSHTVTTVTSTHSGKYTSRVKFLRLAGLRLIFAGLQSSRREQGRAYLNSRLVGPCLVSLSTRARPPINLNIKTQSLHYMYREPHTQGATHARDAPVDAASARLLACSSSSCECIVASLIASTGGMAAMVTEQSGMLGT